MKDDKKINIENNKIIKFINRKNLSYYLIIFGVSLFYFILLLNNDTFYMAHDIVFHISNIKVIASEISFSNIFPGKIFPDLVNNLGYGVNLFYPVFPHLVSAYLYKLLGDIVITFKILDLVIINLAGIVMYKYIYKVFKDRKCALMSAITYISMPYLFADIFIRCALNESFLFFIIPLIFLGIHYLIDDNNKFMFYLLFVLGYVISINSHLVLSVYLTIIILIYLLVFRKKVFRWKVIKEFIIASIFIILLVLNFVVPLLEHYNLGIYDIFNISYEGNGGVQDTDLIHYLFPIRELDIPIYIPIFITIALLYMVVKRKEIVMEDRKILVGMSLIGIFSIVLASSSLIWEIIPNILRNIQFGWRMSLFVTFSVSELFGYILKIIKKENSKTFLIYFLIIFAISNFANSFMIVRVSRDSEMYLKETFNRPRWEQEYLPVETVDNFLNIRQSEKKLSILDGDGEIEVINNVVPNMKFEVKNIDEELVLEFPRIYYLGYELTFEDGKKYDIVLGKDGLVNARVDKDGIYKLEYRGTKLDNISRIIVIISLVIFVIYLIILKKVGKKDGNK